MSAQPDGSNDQRTYGIIIDSSGRAAIPYCQLSSGCGSQPSRAIGGGWTVSSSARGTGPSEQAVYLVEQDKLLSGREMDTVELPRLGSSWSIFGFDAFSSWCAAVRDAARADGPQISRWWSGTIAEAERWVQELAQSGDAQDCFGKTIVELAASSVPQRYLQTDVCMQPRILKALPVFIQSWVHISAQEGSRDPSHFLMFYVRATMTQNEGSPYDNEDWRRLIHAIVQTTSRGELQRASEHVKRWIRYLSRRTSRIARHMSNTSQSTQFNGGKTAYNAAASIFHAVFGKAEPQLFHEWETILRALRIIRPYLQIHETRAGRRRI